MNSTKAMPTIFLPGLGFQSSVFSMNGIDDAIDYPRDSSVTLDNILQALSEKITKPSVIIGWSFGGLIAMNFCERFPEMCEKLILIATTPKFVASEGWPGVAPEIADQLCQEFSPEKFMQWVQYPNRNPVVRSKLQEHATEIQPEYLRLLFTLDNRNIYSQLKIPVLHLLGDQDAIVSIKISDELLKLNPSIELKIFKNAGHALLLTHAEELAHNSHFTIM